MRFIYYLFCLAIFVFAIWFWNCLPARLNGSIINDDYSTVIFDKKGNLLEARISQNGQWMFPINKSIPKKLELAILYFEDEYFYFHFGINPISIIKAAYKNLKYRKIFRGASTISMQVIRIIQTYDKKSSLPVLQEKANIKKNKISPSFSLMFMKNIFLWDKCKRFLRKIHQAILAVRLELKYSKKDILRIYISYAPFGGNVIGLQAASWRYFNRSPDNLSWGEACILAVLPNSPKLIYPGKNGEELKKKRDYLLRKLYIKQIINESTYNLSKIEPVPLRPKKLPQKIPHLMQYLIDHGFKGKKIVTTIDENLQKRAKDLLQKHISILSENNINNAVIIVADCDSGDVICYQGNIDTKNINNIDNSFFVNIIEAERSSGSILKPILFALALEESKILPNSLIFDIPTSISGYNPKNFMKKYNGAVSASDCLSRSLNVPFVILLQNYGLDKFCYNLQKLGISTINKDPNHYGLSVILGGGEVKLSEIILVYLNFARILKFKCGLSNLNYIENEKDISNIKNIDNNFKFAQHKLANTRQVLNNKIDYSFLSPGVIWCMFEAISKMERPMDSKNWQSFSSSQKIAWKTGTSFGNKDAWCIGITPKFVIGVWVGNANGEGRPNLTGLRAAAPIMFDILKILPKSSWFDKPEYDLVTEKICKKSGYKASDICDIFEEEIPISSNKTIICPYHKKVCINSNKTNIIKSCFVLPPVVEFYYMRNNSEYRQLPTFLFKRKGDYQDIMGFIYPNNNSKIYIPRDFNTKRQKIVFEVAHRIKNSKIYWHINEKYLGKTYKIHKIDVFAKPGKYQLLALDNYGNTISKNIEIVKK